MEEQPRRSSRNALQPPSMDGVKGAGVTAGPRRRWPPRGGRGHRRQVVRTFRGVIAVALALTATACRTSTPPPPTVTATPTTTATPLLTVTPAITATPEPTPRTTAWPPDQFSLADLTISLKRTQCYGHCPAYTVTVHGDGRVEYDGEAYVASKGHHEHRIDRASIERILRAMIVENDFFILRDGYFIRRTINVSKEGTVFTLWENVTDGPTTEVRFRIGDREKAVVDYYGAPDGLRDIERTIDEQSGIATWIGRTP